MRGEIRGLGKELIQPLSAEISPCGHHSRNSLCVLDLPQGTIRVRPKGGSGGHNGIRSIIDHVGTSDFPRIRVGIGRPPGQMEPKSYVLQDWNPAEQEVMNEVYERVVATVDTLIEQGILAAMNRFNARPQAEEAPLDP